MRIPFVGPSAALRSSNVDAQSSYNCFLELDDKSPRAPVALYGRPGYTSIGTVGPGPIRNAIEFQDYACVVSGNEVYSVVWTGIAYTITLLGTIATASGPVSMAFNGEEVLIVDGSGGWLADLSSLTQITDPDFPNGVTQATAQDGYFIVTGDGTGSFYINETPRNGAGWNGLDFASAEGSPDNTVACVSYQRELWLFGAYSAEVWVNTGNPDFPFERSGNSFSQVGTAAAYTVRPLDNSIYWLGRDTNGAAMVYRAEGYTPRRISTHGVEKAIAGYAVVSDAFAFTFQLEGHTFYVLTFPTADKTHVYDVSTGEWFEWGWRDPNTSALHRWRPSCAVYFSNKHLVGDYETASFYELSLSTYSDNGDPMLRLRTTQTLESEQQLLTISSLQVDMETGVGLAVGQGSDPQLMLRYHNGRKWSNVKTASVGAAGDYGALAIFRRLGQGRNWRFEISMTDPVKFAVLGGVANA